MQRIIVDLPEPDGPITTTTSWRPTLKLMSLRGEVLEALDYVLHRDDRLGTVATLDLRCVGKSLFGHLMPTPSFLSNLWLSRLIT